MLQKESARYIFGSAEMVRGRQGIVISLSALNEAMDPRFLGFGIMSRHPIMDPPGV